MRIPYLDCLIRYSSCDSLRNQIREHLPILIWAKDVAKTEDEDREVFLQSFCYEFCKPFCEYIIILIDIKRRSLFIQSGITSRIEDN